MNIHLSNLLQSLQNNTSNTTEQPGLSQGTTIQAGGAILHIENGGNLVGTILSGEILDVRNNQVQILLGDNQILTAKLLESLNFNIGEHMLFQVKDNSGGQITIRPVKNDAFPMETISKALESAGLPETDKNIEVIKELMNQGQPIDRQTVLQTLQHSMRHDMPLEMLVTMEKYQIPLTPENVAQFEQYQNLNHQITSQLQQMAEDMPQLLSETLTENGEKAALHLQNHLLSIFLEEPEILQMQQPETEAVVNAENVTEKAQSLSDGNNNPLEVQERQELAEILKKLGADETTTKQMLSDSSTTKQLLGEIHKVLTKTAGSKADSAPEVVKINEQNPTVEVLQKEDLMALFKSRGYEKLVENHLLSRYSLKPEDLQGEDAQKQVKQVFEKMLEDGSQIGKLLSETGKESSSFMNHTENMQNNINFMNDLNQFMTYVQLPIQLSNQEANSELYVLNRKKGKYQEGEEVSAFLHLDLDNLGATDVNIKMKGKQVDTQFTLDNDESMQIVEKHLPELKQHLEKKGYQVEYSVSSSYVPTSTLNTILEKDETHTKIKRYSFDIRA